MICALYCTTFSIRLERADSLRSPLWCAVCAVYCVIGEAGYDGNHDYTHGM